MKFTLAERDSSRAANPVAPCTAFKKRLIFAKVVMAVRAKKADGGVVKAKKGLLSVPTSEPLAPALAKKATVKVLPGKHPLAPREHVGARDSGGKATRTDIRREAPRVSAPRASVKTAERGSQPRSNKSGKK